MVTPELIEYTKGQIASGQSPDTLRLTLLSQGWSEIDVAQALTQAKLAQQNQNSPVSSAPYSSVSSVPPEVEQEESTDPFDFKHLKWYEWLALLPAFFLMIQGGAIGAGIGTLGWFWTRKVMRNQTYSRLAKIFMVIGITIAYYAVTIVSASLFVGVINSISGK